MRPSVTRGVPERCIDAPERPSGRNGVASTRRLMAWTSCSGMSALASSAGRRSRGFTDGIQRRVVAEEEQRCRHASMRICVLTRRHADQVKAGLESLSGLDCRNVRVHANSDKPAAVDALAVHTGQRHPSRPWTGDAGASRRAHAVQQRQDA